jgi:hypothetical protein
MVLGGLIASQVFRARISHFRELRQKKNFSSRIINVTDANDEQKAAIQPILDNFGQAIELMRHRHMIDIREIHEAMRDSLDLHLDDQQMKALDQEFKRMRGREHRMKKHRGSHPNDRHRNKMRRQE